MKYRTIFKTKSGQYIQSSWDVPSWMSAQRVVIWDAIVNENGKILAFNGGIRALPVYNGS